MPRKTRAQTVAESLTRKAKDAMHTLMSIAPDSAKIDGRIARIMLAKGVITPAQRHGEYKLTRFGHDVAAVFVM